MGKTHRTEILPGWKLVPVKPTKAMLDAVSGWSVGGPYLGADDAECVWDVMVDAAPLAKATPALSVGSEVNDAGREDCRARLVRMGADSETLRLSRELMDGVPFKGGDVQMQAAIQCAILDGMAWAAGQSLACALSKQEAGR